MGNLGGWLGHAEARCLRVGSLKARLELDRARVLEIMARMREDQPEGVVQHQHAETEDTHVCEQNQEKPMVVAQHAGRSGAEYKSECARGNFNTDEHKKRAVPNPEYKLTSFAAWWRRVEKEERKFYKEVRKEEEDREKRKEEKEGRKERKKELLTKFFPNFENSPGGKPYLKGNTRDVNSSTLGAVGKLENRRTLVSTFLSDNNIFEIQFTLPEAAAAGSLKLVIEPTGTDRIGTIDYELPRTIVLSNTIGA